MTVTYGFYNSVDSDRLYDAEQMSSIMDGVIEDGVFPSIGDKLLVTPFSGLTVSVGSGRAWFDHTWTLNDSDYNLTLDAADLVYSRIDIVVLEVNSNVGVRANSFKIVKGTAASVPTPPALTNTGNIHQYPLAYITLPNNVTTILESYISIKVGTSLCPYVSGPLAVIRYEELVYFKVFWHDEDISTGNNKFLFLVPPYLVGNVTDWDICVSVPSSSGIVDVSMVNLGSDPEEIEANWVEVAQAEIEVEDPTSLTSSYIPVISNPGLSAGDYLMINVTSSGTGVKGLDVFFIVEKAS